MRVFQREMQRVCVEAEILSRGVNRPAMYEDRMETKRNDARHRGRPTLRCNWGTQRSTQSKRREADEAEHKAIERVIGHGGAGCVHDAGKSCLEEDDASLTRSHNTGLGVARGHLEDTDNDPQRQQTRTFEGSTLARLRLAQEKDLDFRLRLACVYTLLTQHLVDVLADLAGILLSLDPVLAIDRRLVGGWLEGKGDGVRDFPAAAFHGGGGDKSKLHRLQEC